MAKQLKEIRGFGKGIANSVSSEDMPDSASPYSKNVHPHSAHGILKAINEDHVLIAGANFSKGSTGYISDGASILEANYDVSTDSVRFSYTGKDHILDSSTPLAFNVVVAGITNINIATPSIPVNPTVQWNSLVDVPDGIAKLVPWGEHELKIDGGTWGTSTTIPFYISYIQKLMHVWTGGTQGTADLALPPTPTWGNRGVFFAGHDNFGEDVDVKAELYYKVEGVWTYITEKVAVLAVGGTPLVSSVLCLFNQTAATSFEGTVIAPNVYTKFQIRARAKAQSSADWDFLGMVDFNVHLEDTTGGVEEDTDVYFPTNGDDFCRPFWADNMPPDFTGGQQDVVQPNSTAKYSTAHYAGINRLFRLRLDMGQAFDAPHYHSYFATGGDGSDQVINDWHQSTNDWRIVSQGKVHHIDIWLTNEVVPPEGDKFAQLVYSQYYSDTHIPTNDWLNYPTVYPDSTDYWEDHDRTVEFPAMVTDSMKTREKWHAYKLVAVAVLDLEKYQSGGLSAEWGNLLTRHGNNYEGAYQLSQWYATKDTGAGYGISQASDYREAYKQVRNESWNLGQHFTLYETATVMSIGHTYQMNQYGTDDFAQYMPSPKSVQMTALSPLSAAIDDANGNLIPLPRVQNNIATGSPLSLAFTVSDILTGRLLITFTDSFHTPGVSGTEDLVWFNNNYRFETEFFTSIGGVGVNTMQTLNYDLGNDSAINPILDVSATTTGKAKITLTLNYTQAELQTMLAAQFPNNTNWTASDNEGTHKGLYFHIHRQEGSSTLGAANPLNGAIASWETEMTASFWHYTLDDIGGLV
tara:strand:+ start:5030 stop:7447 length:2418 start_codon:yes stop_codon:yes gene_type:complete